MRYHLLRIMHRNMSTLESDIYSHILQMTMATISVLCVKNNTFYYSKFIEKCISILNFSINSNINFEIRMPHTHSARPTKDILHTQNNESIKNILVLAPIQILNF